MAKVSQGSSNLGGGGREGFPRGNDVSRKKKNMLTGFVAEDTDQFRVSTRGSQKGVLAYSKLLTR